MHSFSVGKHTFLKSFLHCFSKQQFEQLNRRKPTKFDKEHAGGRNSLSAISCDALEVAGVCSVKVPYSQARPIAGGTEGDPARLLDNRRIVLQPANRGRRIAGDFTVQLCRLAKGGSYVVHRLIKRQEVICFGKRKKGE